MSASLQLAAPDIDRLRAWIGKSESRHEVIDTFPVRALAALLASESVPREGDADSLTRQEPDS